MYSVGVKEAPLAGILKSVIMQILSFDTNPVLNRMFILLYFSVWPWLAPVAACGLLFHSASSWKALSKTTVTWMITNYKGWLHWWTSNRQAVLFNYWEISIPSFALSCNTDLIFNLINGKIEKICQKLHIVHWVKSKPAIVVVWDQLSL